ncbi:MAG: MBL fold metallo-hydrolase [Myxococcales bacterium]|nr:MBL fold metallo-hydrolase [Myxococcales bacterium]
MKLPDPISSAALGGNSILKEQLNKIYLVAAGDGALIDAGYVTAENRRALQTLYDRFPFAHVFLTHGHRDHAEAAAWVAETFDCTVHIHPNETLVGAAVDPSRLRRDLLDGARFVFGELTLVVLHTPGHTPGHCVFHLEPLELLFSGDLVLGEGTTWVGPPDGRMSDYLASLRRVQQLPLRMIAPGHGPLVEGGRERVDELIAHRLMREEQVLTALAQGATELGFLVESVYPDLAAERIPLAHLTLLGHLEKLIEEGRVARRGARYEAID